MTMRFLYRFLLRLHPRAFRERFAEEMTAIFDEAAGTLGAARLLGDALLSLIRQWTFRPHPVVASVAKPSGDVPAFAILDSYAPRRLALIEGGVLSAIFFWMVIVAATNGARPIMLLGASSFPRSGLLKVNPSSVQLASRDAAVRVPPPAADPWYDFASHYFKIIYVLGALDADHDYVISAAEIAAAPAALLQLDLNGDGKLSAAESGFYIGGAESIRPGLLNGFRTAFMSANPVLAALDTDHDGEISAREILNAPAALRRLDLNGDGKLLPVEIAPESVVRQILMSTGGGPTQTENSPRPLRRTGGR
jgi:hypothetical protein